MPSTISSAVTIEFDGETIGHYDSTFSCRDSFMEDLREIMEDDGLIPEDFPRGSKRLHVLAVVKLPPLELARHLAVRAAVKAVGTFHNVEVTLNDRRPIQGFHALPEGHILSNVHITGGIDVIDAWWWAVALARTGATGDIESFSDPMLPGPVSRLLYAHKAKGGWSSEPIRIGSTALYMLYEQGAVETPLYGGNLGFAMCGPLESLSVHLRRSSRINTLWADNQDYLKQVATDRDTIDKDNNNA
jgi:hypothetical protein